MQEIQSVMTETMDVLIDTGKEVSDMGDVISTYITSPEKNVIKQRLNGDNG